MSSQVFVMNLSKALSGVDGNSITLAINSVMPAFCMDWAISVPTVSYAENTARPFTMPATAPKVFVVDLSDASVEASIAPFGNTGPYSVVYAQEILNDGGVALFDTTRTTPTIAQVISHEVFELLSDPLCSMWWMNSNNSVLYAAEVCDPVQGNVVPVRLPSKVSVAVSDWVLPAWFNISNTDGPFNHLDTLTTPFSVESNGYVLTLKNGVLSYSYGSTASAWQRSYSKQNLRYGGRANSVKH